jgi:predicted transposase/invertase (TIGR01784 family)
MQYNEPMVPELLPPYEDGVFKTLLIRDDAKPILRDIVESYLRISVTNVVVRNVELPISDINEKRERFDVNCTVDDGSQIDIEMQADQMSGDSLSTHHKIVKSRAIYHLCDLHSSQFGRNVRYDNLMRSFQITFCGYSVFPKRKDFVSRFSFRDECGNELSDSVGIIFVELTKLDEVIKKPVKKMTGEEAWAAFFAYASDPKYKDLIGKLVVERKEIDMAREILQNISQDEIERARFRSRRMFEMDMPIDDISKATGLTPDEISELGKTI